MVCYLKQLLPLTYWTKCTVEGVRFFVIWRMWFGRCFDVVWIDLGDAPRG